LLIVLIGITLAAKLGHALNEQGGDLLTEELYEVPSD
jgi:hypothetical protein